MFRCASPGGFFAALLPWMIRNKSTMGRYQLLPLQGGVQLWEFNGRIFTDAFSEEQEGAKLLYGPVRARWIHRLNRPELAEFPDFTDETEFERDSILNHTQIAFLRANPVLFLELSACRFAEFFKPFPLNDFSFAHTFLGVLSFFWVGLFFARGHFFSFSRVPRGLPGGCDSRIHTDAPADGVGDTPPGGLDVPLFIAA